MARIAASAASSPAPFPLARPARGSLSPAVVLGSLVAFLCASACSRGPVRIRPDKRPDAAGDASPGSTDAPTPDVADPVPADPCDPVGLLSLIPRSVTTWSADDAPVYPFENFAGIAVGFVGRLFRSDAGCVVLGVSRPADLEAAIKALTVERHRTVDVEGRLGMIFPSVGANQVTTWVRDGDDRLFLLRAYGTVDPDVLQPFLDALFPASPAAGEDATGDAGAVAARSDAAFDEELGADATDPPDCSGRYPIADEFDPATFWGPPGDCWKL